MNDTILRWLYANFILPFRWLAADFPANLWAFVRWSAIGGEYIQFWMLYVSWALWAVGGAALMAVILYALRVDWSGDKSKLD